MSASRYTQRFPARMRLAEDDADDSGQVESVSGLTARIKALLEGSIPQVWVRGEISNLRAQASGHFYFSLKDAGSQIPCVMFRGDAARSDGGAVLRDGSQVVAFGGISVYEPRGSYQLIVRAVVADGEGRLQREFERLKQRLAAEGLFDAARKKPLPVLPLTVGFITSPTGAAVQDFIRILKRRHWRGRLLVLPARVQGDGAAAELFGALEIAHRLADAAAGPHIDLLVIGRGGGSLEDLWAFNEEPLVRAVAGSRIPIVSAVGHEIDFTLCDFAADVRAETPSAAAELISSGFLDVAERVRQAGRELDGMVDDGLRRQGDALEIMRGRFRAVSPVARLEQAALRIDDVGNRIESAVRHALQARRHELAAITGRMARVNPEPRIERARERLSAIEARFSREAGHVLANRRQVFSRAEARLLALGPDSVLRRGFVILRDAGGKPVVSRKAVRPGQRLSGQFHDGDAPLVAE
jgi:exodeoxyribonuclease VII large subunit